MLQGSRRFIGIDCTPSPAGPRPPGRGFVSCVAGKCQGPRVAELSNGRQMCRRRAGLALSPHLSPFWLSSLQRATREKVQVAAVGWAACARGSQDVAPSLQGCAGSQGSSGHPNRRFLVLGLCSAPWHPSQGLGARYPREEFVPTAEQPGRPRCGSQGLVSFPAPLPSPRWDSQLLQQIRHRPDVCWSCPRGQLRFLPDSQP